MLASCGVCTTQKVALRTKGSTTSNTGKAISHDSPQEPSHSRKNPAAKPTLRKVLTNETMQVMMMDRNKGVTTVA